MTLSSIAERLASALFLRGVKNAPDFHDLPYDPVHRDIWQWQEQEFPRSFDPARTANMRRVLQTADFLVQLPHRRLTILRVMLSKVLADTLQVGCGGRRPANAHLGAQHLLEPGVHFFLFYKFVPVGVGFAF